MEKTKVKKSAFDYLPWAGRFVDAFLEPELFAQLPGRVQRERLFMRQEFGAGRRPTFEEIERAGRGPEPDEVAVTLSSTFTLDSLRVAGDPPPGSMMRELEDALSQESLFAHCTAFGEGRRLLTRTPTHGLYAYLWALTLIRRGMLKTLPLTFFFDLEEGLYAITGKKFNTRTDAALPLLQALDRWADVLASSVA